MGVNAGKWEGRILFSSFSSVCFCLTSFSPKSLQVRMAGQPPEARLLFILYSSWPHRLTLIIALIVYISIPNKDCPDCLGQGHASMIRMARAHEMWSAALPIQCRRKEKEFPKDMGIQHTENQSDAREKTNKLRGKKEWVIGLEILMRLVICAEKWHKS